MGSWALPIAYSAILWGILGHFLWRRLHAGPVIVHLGRDTTRLLLAIVGAALLLTVVLPLVTGPGRQELAGDVAPTAGGIVGAVSCAAYCIVTGLTPAQVREGGILGGPPLFPYFLPWDRVESYEIAGGVLQLTARWRWRVGGTRPRYRLTLRLAPQHRAAVEAALRRYLTERQV